MAAGLGFKTFTTGEVLTAADTNGYLMQGILVFASAAARDSAITSPQEGQACYLKDTNEVLTYSGSAWVAVGGASVPANASATVATSQSTTSESFTDLTTAGPAVTVTTGTKALVILTAEFYNNTGDRGAYMGFAVSGATTTAAAQEKSAGIFNGTATPAPQVSAVYSVTLTAGSNTFTAKYKRSGASGTAVFANRNIFVINLA